MSIQCIYDNAINLIQNGTISTDDELYIYCTDMHMLMQLYRYDESLLIRNIQSHIHEHYLPASAPFQTIPVIIVIALTIASLYFMK